MPHHDRLKAERLHCPCIHSRVHTGMKHEKKLPKIELALVTRFEIPNPLEEVSCHPERHPAQ